MQRFQNEVLFPPQINVELFFHSLAEVLADVFKSKLVTIWDNNLYSKTLVLQSSCPKRQPEHGSYAIATERSFTGLAVERHDIVVHYDLTKDDGKRRFSNPRVVEEFGLKWMVSIPVYHLVDGKRYVTFVINLCFDSDNLPSCPISSSEMDQLVRALKLSLDYLMHGQYEKVRDIVLKVASQATGVSGLFDGIKEPLQKFTKSKYVTLFRWDATKCQLVNEISTDKDTPLWIELSVENGDPREGQKDVYYRIFERCVKEGKSFVWREGLPKLDIDSKGWLFDVQCQHMAVPIKSASNDVLGILECREPEGKEPVSVSFSSLDIQILETFAQSISPYIERFLRFREGSRLMKVVEEVSSAMGQAYQLNDFLQQTIERSANALNAEVGSIYLIDEGTDTLVMSAAHGFNKNLIGKAKYKIGQGLTGEIARGKILNLKTHKEVISHPKYVGKYDDRIWDSEKRRKCDTFLGVPIQAKDQILGVWKVENLKKSTDHPSPYFTDEDVQVTQVLSRFIAYAIENYQQEERKRQQFMLLAQNTIDIETTKTQEDAIFSVICGLEEAGFPASVLSLYDSKTLLIKGCLSSGAIWTNIEDFIEYPISEDNILAEVLRNNKSQFIPDSRKDPRCEEQLVKKFGIKAQYVLPLRLDNEMIGTLQIGMGDKSSIQEDEKLILQAFASHLAIALSRIRSIEQSLEMTDKIMSSSRFIVAETLSSMAVHSTRHQLGIILSELGDDLQRKEIKENRFLKETLDSWYDRLDKMRRDLTNSLTFVRPGETKTIEESTKLQPLIQKSVDMWIEYIHQHKCTIYSKLEATKSLCDMPLHAFQEIMSVLIVNSVQAHAKKVEIKTYNGHNIDLYRGITIKDAICLEFADDGIGLQTKNLEEIFEPSYTTKPNKFGTGLGLFIAQRLARQRAGDLRVVPKRVGSKGVTFRLILPLKG